MTYYELLGVAPTASVDEIHRAYRGAIRRFHPDVNKASNAAAVTMRLNEAWGTLCDRVKRAEYDRRLAFAGARSRSAAQPRPSQTGSGRRPSYDGNAGSYNGNAGSYYGYSRSYERPGWQRYERRFVAAPSFGTWLAAKIVTAALQVVVVFAFIAFVFHSLPLVMLVCGGVLLARMLGRRCA